MSSTAILPSLLYQHVGNPTLNLISPDFSYFFPGFTSISISYLSMPWLLPLSLGSAERLYIRAEFVISLYTEEGLFSATETTVCNLSEFYCGLNVVYSPGIKFLCQNTYHIR